MTKSCTTHVFVLCIIIAIVSCNPSSKKKNTEKEDALKTELKGFMVGGMYFYNGYGGVSETQKIVNQYGRDKTATINAYKELFILPFKSDQAASAKSTLKEWWNINNKEEFLAVIKKLEIQKDPENPHKAWDYARFVNNVCMGFSANYLTEKEAKKYVSENLVLVQKDFKTWNDFIADFNEGRKIWNPDSPDIENYKQITTDMLDESNTIYQLIPLN